MVKIVVFVIALFLGVANCYPAQDSKEDAPSEFDFVPLERGPFRPPFLDSEENFGDQPIIDTPAYLGSSYFGNPFSNLFGGLENALARMRQQLSVLLNRLPATNGTEDGIQFSGFGDLGKGNTTSVTKIIDGHKVIINETEYHKEGPHGGAFVKISVIDVRPENPETTEVDAEQITTSSTVEKDRESVEDSFENEIPKTNEGGFYDNIETFDDVDSMPVDNRDWNKLENFSEEKPIFVPYEPIRDLSNDIDVNKYMADAGVPPDPDAEVFDAVDAQLAFKKFENYAHPRI